MSFRRMDRREFLFRSGVALAALPHHSWAQDDDFTVAGASLPVLRPGPVLDPGSPVDKIFLGGDGSTAFLAEDRVKETASIIRIVRVPAMSRLAEIALPHAASVLVADPVGTGLIVAGEGTDFIGVSILDREGASILHARLPKGDTAFAIAADKSGSIYMGSPDRNILSILGRDAFKPLPEGSGVISVQRKETLPGLAGISKLAVTEDGQLVFALDSLRPALIAYTLQKGAAPIGQIGGASSDQRTNSLNFIVKSVDSAGKGAETTCSFLLSEPERGRLSLVDFNRDFSTFDLIGDTVFAEGNSGPRAGQEVILDSNVDQSVILVGSGGSVSADVYSKKRSALQRLYTVTLPASPAAFSMSTDGNRAIMLSRRGAMFLLTSDGGGDTSSGNNDPVPILIGDQGIRQLQAELTKKGFSIGAIDGIAGPRTELAIRKAIEQYGFDPTISKQDPLALIRALQNLKSAN
jgi:hypothetical protein